MGDLVYHYKNNLYLNITNQCPNNCEFCDIKSIGQDINTDLILKSEPDFDSIIENLDTEIDKYSIDEIVFCGGGEPLMRLNLLLDIADYINKHYPVDIRLNTTGYPYTFYQNRDVAKDLQINGVDTVRISLNATSPEEYQDKCQPEIQDAYQKTLQFIQECQETGLNTSISFVNYDINIAECKKLTQKLDTELIIREYAPINDDI